MATPRISVIVPIYKAENTLRMCLDSVRAQTMTDFEVILVNDGSPDNSGEICKAYAEQDGRFRYVYKENGGLSDARNKGLELARGEYIMFVDSDDAIAEHTMACLMQIINATAAEIVSFDFTTEPERLHDEVSFQFEEERLITENVLQQYFFKEVSACNRIFKAELIGDTRFIVGQISEDVLFVFECYRKAARLYKANYPFYFYNQTGTGSITRSGLSVADNTSVDANLRMYAICKEKYPENSRWAELQVYKSMFNIVNKYAMRGYANEQAQEFYQTVMPEYVKTLRRNAGMILRGETISRNDKIQVSVLSISFPLFLRLKRWYEKSKRQKSPLPARVCGKRPRTVCYVSSTMRAEDFAALFPDRDNMPGQQVQKFHRLLIEGFGANGVPVRAVSAIPINRQNFHKIVYGGGRLADGGITYRYLPTVNLPVVKNVLNMLGVFFEVLRLGSEDAVVCDVLNASVSYAASAAARLRGIRCVGIVTDLPEYMTAGQENARYRKTVQRCIANCSHYMLLTEQMNDVINPGGKPYIVVEGICDRRLADAVRAERGSTLKCLYAGILYEGYGVKNLVDGFILADIPGAELHIYGIGSYAAELTEVCKEHENVIYHGRVLNEEVVRAELEADLLINPRPTDEEFTKYSFPSKNLEYMASGTAVLTTRLPGMPEEYCPHVYLIEDESARGNAQSLRRVLALSREERDAKGAAGREFVLREKSNKAQTERILRFLEMH